MTHVSNARNVNRTLDYGVHVQADALDRSSLASINAYSPGLSGAWMLQRAMSVRPGRPPKPEFINSLLGSNFASMERNGDATLKPFLQVSEAFHF